MKLCRASITIWIGKSTRLKVKWRNNLMRANFILRSGSFDVFCLGSRYLDGSNYPAHSFLFLYFFAAKVTHGSRSLNLSGLLEISLLLR